ncbi:MAG: 30S ribosomal protein S15 [Candidatus Anstonellales archaeon]
MARMHSKKKGKSSRGVPKRAVPAEWALPKKEVEAIILKLAKQGKSATQIGLELRDKHGIPDVRTIIGMRLRAFLQKENAAHQIPDDLLKLIEKAVKMRKHLKAHKGDVHNKSKLIRAESKIRRLVKYYVREGKLPAGWKYIPEEAALLVR